jgi:ABC-type transport system involved in multi-copper enzyme maturation permease subunit
MLTTIRYILLTALRDWLFIGLFASLIAAIAISSFLGGTALVEESQMSITYAAASTRVILLVGLIVFVCFHVRTSFQNREIELILSRPISRISFVFAYWLGFSLIVFFLVLPLMAVFLSMTDQTEGVILWSVSLMMEALFVVAFSLFASLILSSAVASVLLSFGFYFISRMMGFFLFILESPGQFNSLDTNYVTGKIVLFISTMLPRLDQFGKSEWLVSGIATDENYYIFFGQTLVYIPFLLILAIYDFKRKQF